MLEFLEDIIGSSRFKEPTGILKTRVDDLDEHRTEKLNRVKLVEKEKDELEKPKDEAMHFLQEMNKIAKKTDILYQLRVRMLKFERVKMANICIGLFVFGWVCLYNKRLILQ